MAATFTDGNFQDEVIKSDIPVLVDFFATWCGPCVMIAPIIEELAEKYKGKVKIGKLNVDENPETSQNYGVQSIPSLLIIKDGQVVDKIVGVQPKEVLEEKLNAL